jgi:hypothetical protein
MSQDQIADSCEVDLHMSGGFAKGDEFPKQMKNCWFLNNVFYRGSSFKDAFIK